MRLRQSMRRVLDAEVAIMRVGAQAVGLEIFLAMMTDGDALLRPRFRLGCSRAALGLDGLASRGFASAPQTRPFLPHCRLCCRPRWCLLPGHFHALPFFVDRERLAQNWKFADFVEWAKARLRR